MEDSLMCLAFKPAVLDLVASMQYQNCNSYTPVASLLQIAYTGVVETFLFIVFNFIIVKPIWHHCFWSPVQDVDTIYLSQDSKELCLKDFDHLEGR